MSDRYAPYVLCDVSGERVITRKKQMQDRRRELQEKMMRADADKRMYHAQLMELEAEMRAEGFIVRPVRKRRH